MLLASETRTADSCAVRFVFRVEIDMKDLFMADNEHVALFVEVRVSIRAGAPTDAELHEEAAVFSTAAGQKRAFGAIPNTLFTLRPIRNVLPGWNFALKIFKLPLENAPQLPQNRDVPR